MNLYDENFVLKYRKTDSLSVTIIAKAIDSQAAINILGAVLQENYEYVKQLKDKFNFQCIVIKDGTETIL